MQLKRKRSESELSLSSSGTGSTFNTPPRPDPSSWFAFSQMDTENISPMRRQMATASHLPSRTMKRFRNGRPSEEEVHQRTIDMLFSAAQKSQPPHYEAPLQPRPHAVQVQPSVPVPPQQHHPQQASLHSFWKLPNANSLSAALAPVASPIVDASIFAPSDCEDCGQRLRGNGEDTVDVDMDMDSYGAGEAETSCAGCGKHVCSHCSITNMGERRRCLSCADAGKKGWAGGIGWAAKSMGLGIF